jgi:hypothetical protein
MRGRPQRTEIPFWKQGCFNLKCTLQKKGTIYRKEGTHGFDPPPLPPPLYTPPSANKALVATTLFSFFDFIPPSRQIGKLLLRSSELGLPQPLTCRRMCPPPPLVPGGGSHSLARDGVGESQFRRGDVHCGTLFICTLCVILYVWHAGRGVPTTSHTHGHIVPIMYRKKLWGMAPCVLGRPFSNKNFFLLLQHANLRKFYLPNLKELDTPYVATN